MSYVEYAVNLLKEIALFGAASVLAIIDRVVPVLGNMKFILPVMAILLVIAIVTLNAYRPVWRLVTLPMRIMSSFWSLVGETLIELGKALLEIVRLVTGEFVSLCAWNGWIAVGATMVVLMSLLEIILPEPFNQQASSLFQNLILGELLLWLIYKFLNRTPGGHGKHHDHGHGHDHH